MREHEELTPHRYTDRTDRLGTEKAEGSLLIFNYGDAAFLRVTQFPPPLLPEEAIFLRLVSYLPFIEEVAVPARLIFDSEPLMNAIELAAPLLRNGIVRPERRATAASFSDLASERGLGPVGRERAERLDDIASRPRLFRFDELQETYIELLRLDLAPSGAFRKTIDGAHRGRRAPLLDRALADYMQSADGTPENFAQTISRHAPELLGPALRWAMARYYATPALFDDKNLREMPKPAAQLLLSARAKDQMSLPAPTPTPVDVLFQRLAVSLPAHRIRLDAERYCEAVLSVRSRIPEARKLSQSLLSTTEAHTLSQEISNAFAREFERQQLRKAPKGVKFVLVSTLIGSAAGIAADLFIAPGASVPVGAGAAFATDRIQRRLERRRNQLEAPWILVVDEMDRITRGRR